VGKSAPPEFRNSVPENLRVPRDFGCFNGHSTPCFQSIFLGTIVGLFTLKNKFFQIETGSTHLCVGRCVDARNGTIRQFLQNRYFFGVFEGGVEDTIAAHRKASQPPKHPQTGWKAESSGGNSELWVSHGSSESPFAIARPLHEQCPSTLHEVVSIHSSMVVTVWHTWFDL